MAESVTFEKLSETHISEIARLGHQLNPKLSLAQVRAYFEEMFQFSTYHCFGLYIDQQLVGISSGWITIRLYSGKQLEVDNVIIDNALQSKGLGKVFFEHIENWAKAENCKTIELNTYVQNSKSHKFYFNLGYSILGFHFWKAL